LRSTRLDELKGFTEPRYEKHLINRPGQEHYALLHYIMFTYGDCRHVVDIGTRYVTSSIALSSAGHNVETFDLPESTERFSAFRNVSESKWKELYKARGAGTISFNNVDLLKMPEVKFKRFFSTWLVMLDTAHLPDTVPFEREFLARIHQIGYKGIMILDDIHLNSEMIKWWSELLRDQEKFGYRAIDVTSVGHVTGTGLLDFSGLFVFNAA
jgi:hypothetical protein